MVALVFCGDLKYCPYMKRYVERLEKNKCEYNVYFWNRSGFDLDLPANYYYYDSPSDLKKGKAAKLFDFFGFRKWVGERLEMDKADRYILLSTLTGVLLGRSVYSQKGKYVFDIRDYSYEHIPFFRMIEKKVIANSAFTAISSKGFETFLPKHDYVIAHNFNREDIVPDAAFRRTNGKIKVVWNGVIRYFEFQKQYLDALKNDERFEMIYHGDGPELNEYKEYCAENGFTNVTFTGSYNNADKVNLLADANILNNCYGYTHHAGSKLKYAVSNRFYDGMIYHIPQLVEPDGYKTDWAGSKNLGIGLTISDHFADDLCSYYAAIDSETFDLNCKAALAEILAEDDRYISEIDAFLKG